MGPNIMSVVCVLQTHGHLRTNENWVRWEFLETHGLTSNWLGHVSPKTLIWQWSEEECRKLRLGVCTVYCVPLHREFNMCRCTVFTVCHCTVYCVPLHSLLCAVAQFTVRRCTEFYCVPLHRVYCVSLHREFTVCHCTEFTVCHACSPAAERVQ